MQNVKHTRSFETEQGCTAKRNGRRRMQREIARDLHIL